jgi:peptide/nickel transport system permease protein
MKRFFGNKNFAVGFFLSAVILVLAAASLVWTPYDGNRMNARERLQGPSWAHPLGTDQYGRDTLSRVMSESVWAFWVPTAGGSRTRPSCAFRIYSSGSRPC